MKKGLFPLAALLLLVLTLTGCIKTNGQSEGFSGVYSGECGTLAFSEIDTILVNFSDEHVWSLNGKANNATYGYTFVKGNKETTFDKAEYLSLHEGGTLFVLIECSVSRDKIILYPDGPNETVLYRADK